MGVQLSVANLSFKTTEDGLRDAFSQFGTVVSVVLLIDKVTHKPRGFATVQMSSPAEAAAAMKGLNGAELDGRVMSVSQARSR